MERSIQLLNDLYTSYKDLMILIIGTLIGWILTKLLPAICSYISRFVSLIGKKLGGRLAHKNIRETYLNWLVYKTQDLNLTGIIGSGEKPKLEQIFISLRIVKEYDKISKKDDVTEAEITKSFMKTLSAQYYEYLNLFISSFLLDLSYLLIYNLKKNKSEMNIFTPNSLWKISHIYNREGLDRIIIILIYFVSLYIIPISLFLKLNLFPYWDFFGSTLWSILTIISIYVIYISFQDADPSIHRPNYMSFRLIFLFLITAPIIPIYSIVQNNIIHGLQSPLSIEGGIIVGTVLSGILLVYLNSGPQFRTYDRYTSNKLSAKGIGDILSSNNYIAILGKPGSGKSTLSQFLALTFAKEKAGDPKIKRKGCLKDRFGTNEWCLPIFIPLKDISKFLVEADSKRYDNLIIEAFRQKILPSNIRNVLTDSYIYHMLKNKKCLFLLDGLDEVQDSFEFNAVSKEINGIISRFPENKVIVTSRHSGWRGGIGSQFNVFEIEDLNDEEISSFIDSWYNAIEENRTRISEKIKSKEEQNFWKGEAYEKANKLKQALSDTKSIRQIAENPLLLSIVCFVHYNKTLPKERLRLYEDCSNLLLVQWDEEKGLAIDDTKLTSARKEEIIQEIAFSFHTGKIGEAFGRKEATGDEIIPIVEKKLKEFEMDPKQAGSLFQKLIDRSGIIVITDKYANKYSFSHLTFQEFYSAKYLYVNQLDIFQVISEGTEKSTDALNGWWREVLLLYCLLIRDPSKIIEELYRDSENDILQQNLQLAVQCLDESVKVTNQGVRDKIIEQVLLIRAHRSSKSQIESLDPRIVSYLFNFAQSPLFYRHVILNKIIQVKNDEVSFLISKIVLLSQSANRHMRLIAVDALNLLAFKFDIYRDIDPRFLNELLNDPDSNVQRATAKLMLDTYPRPLDDTISNNIFNIIERNLTSNEYDLLESMEFKFDYLFLRYYLDSKSSFNLAEESCQILRQLMEASSEGVLVDFRTKMEKIAINTFNAKTKEIGAYYGGYYYPCFECVLKNLILMGDEKLNEIYKFQLLEALLKGNTHQQIFAIQALSELYGSDDSIVQLVLDKLNAPHSKVRIAVLSSLNKLNIKDDGFQNILTYLEYHRKPFSTFKASQKFVTQILIGRGEIGLAKTELISLETYFKHKDKANTRSTSKKPRFDEMGDKIDNFLHKKDLSRKISNYRFLNGHGKSLDENSLLELVNKPNISLNEAVFDILLEKKIV